MLPLPKIVLSASNYPRLEELARAATQRGGHERDVSDGRDQPRRDCSGRCLRYSIDRNDRILDHVLDELGRAAKDGAIVWPEDCTSDLAQISVLSPLGAALIGLHVGDQTPYFVAGRMNVVEIESVTEPSPMSCRWFMLPCSPIVAPLMTIQVPAPPDRRRLLNHDLDIDPRIARCCTPDASKQALSRTVACPNAFPSSIGFGPSPRGAQTRKMS